MVKSRYSISQLLLHWLVFFLFLLFTGLIWLPTKKPGSTWELLCCFTFLIGILLAYYFHTRNPRIYFTEDFIQINYLFSKKKYDWNTITQVYLSTKEMPAYTPRPEEATTITFNNGKRHII